MIFVGKAAARPAQIGDLQLFQGLQYIVAVTLCVGNVGFGAYPKAAIDAGSQVFGELAVYVFTDLLCSLLGIYTDARIFLSEQGECQKGKGTDE